MTRLCAPVKSLVETDKVDLQEIDKILYEKGVPRYIDVDWKKTPPKNLPVIVSYHNFEETPDLEKIYQTLKETHPNAHYYKIATFANSTLDSLRMLLFLKKHPQVIGLCMGELGQITRICAPIFDVPIAYAPLEEKDKNAPGQLTVDELSHIYHFHSLNPSTELFGLIGAPVSHSPGHLFHNDYFRTHRRNAVYLKMAVQPHELGLFFQFAQQLPFRGLSVTAPLKELVLPHRAVNTLLLPTLEGYNTDGEAAINALGNIQDKVLVILGAGGAARAIALSCVQQGAHVIIVNRTLEKGKKLSQELRCYWSETVPDYDIVINATTSSMPIQAEVLRPGKIVMDISLYETEFFKTALKRGCHCIDGWPMYVHQALAQQKLWSRFFSDKI